MNDKKPWQIYLSPEDKKYQINIMHKKGIDNRADATRYALKFTSNMLENGKT